jgi:CubicO group peptidase (beta-lactamase class C family)
MEVRMPTLLAVALATALGCGGGDDGPAWQWEVQTPEAQQMDSTTLDGARAYAFQPGKNTQGVVVTRRGVLVAEWYEDGRDMTSYAASWSAAKSFASAIVGIAIDEGAIAGVDVPLTDYYPQWEGTGHAAITLETVLHMATGLEWVEAYQLSNANESDVAQLVLTTDSPLDYVLSKPLEADPDTEFEYSSGDTLLLSGIVEQGTGMPAGEFAEDRLFSKLDIEGADWWQAQTGETLTYCCVDMTSRDFARFGLLFMQNGMWEGEQIVPADWVEASITPSPLYDGYGYQWWLVGRYEPDLPDDLFAALGLDGQFIYVIPSLDLVVVRNGHYDKDIGPPIADPTLFIRYPSSGLTPGAGTLPPDEWSHAAFLGPILDSITD